ncbi:MAG: nucleoside deaminase [Oscillospiraceae bacterium]|nr:nucleoside deaminase [Oscillospiraceae bacterium]
MKSDLHYMRIALRQAKKAAAMGEVPVGAVLVKRENDGSEKIVSYGYNKREKCKNALMHAEISAIDKACRRLKSWRLSDCTLYVTLEPCPMCAGAAINARLSRVVFGARDLRFGACGSAVNLYEVPFNHIPKLQGPIMQEQCAAILTDFFKARRKKL